MIKNWIVKKELKCFNGPHHEYKELLEDLEFQLKRFQRSLVNTLNSHKWLKKWVV